MCKQCVPGPLLSFVGPGNGASCAYDLFQGSRLICGVVSVLPRVDNTDGFAYFHFFRLDIDGIPVASENGLKILRV